MAPLSSQVQSAFVFFLDAALDLMEAAVGVSLRCDWGVESSPAAMVLMAAS
jgi:hypothetical protein